MAKFVRGDVLIFTNTHQYRKVEIDKCTVVYSDDLNYYFNSSILQESLYTKEESLFSIPIDEIDTGIREYQLGLKTILKHL